MTMPSFCSQIHRVAKKTHICTECGGEILPLDVYEYVSGKWGGEFNQYKTCTHCEQSRDIYVELMNGQRDPDDGDFSFGDLRSDLIYLAQDSDPVQRFRIFRLVVKMDKRKKR